MARRLQDKLNAIAPGGAYPYGRAKDNTGSNNGVPVNESLVGDLLQFFERIMVVGGVSPNLQPENNSDGFQYVTALINIIVAQATTLVSAEAATRLAADTTLQNNINSEASTRSAADIALQASIDAASGGLLTAIVPIGDWDMDANVSKLVPHGLTDIKIRTVDVIIINDAGDRYWPLNKVSLVDGSTIQGGVGQISSVNVNLIRLGSGDYDSNSYDSTPFNRGFLIIRHVP